MDETENISPKATSEEMKSDQDREIKNSEPTMEEWQASIDSMTPEEVQLLERIQSEVQMDSKRISFTRQPRDDQEADPYYDVEEEEASWEKYQEILTNAGYDESEIEWLKKASSDSVIEARIAAIERLILDNGLLGQPSMIPVICGGFQFCRLPHEGVKEIKRLMEEIKKEQETNVSLIRAFNHVLVLNYGIPAKGMDRSIQKDNEDKPKNLDEVRQENPLAPKAISFNETVKRYDKYFQNGEMVNDLPLESKHLVVSGDFTEPYNINFHRAEMYAPHFTEEFKRWFGGERVIDLGCGPKAEYMAESVMKWGAKEYIGVDKNYLADSVNKFGKKQDIGCIAVRDDILTFLKNEPESSATLVINGMDEYIFNMDRGDTRYYIEQLAKEIDRVVGSSHKIVGIESFPIFSEMEKLGYKRSRLGFPSEFMTLEVVHKEAPRGKSELLDLLINHKLRKEN